MRRGPLYWCVTGLTLGVALVAVLGWFGSAHPWLEMLTNAPTALAAASITSVVATAAMRMWPHFAAAGLVVASLLYSIGPYWFADPDPLPAGGDTLRALQFNVFFGNDDIDRIAGVIHEADADVVALHEITSEQWRQLQPRLDRFPHAISAPWDGPVPQLGGGMALLSRTPLERLDITPQASIDGRPVLAAATRIDDEPLVVVGLHPHASRFEASKVALRERQLDAVVELLSDDEGAAIILADLNIAPTSPTYRALIEELGWRDPHRLAGWDASWPSWAGPFGIPIDHVLVSDAVALHDVRAVEGAGSDHRALIAEFSLR